MDGMDKVDGISGERCLPWLLPAADAGRSVLEIRVRADERKLVLAKRTQINFASDKPHLKRRGYYRVVSSRLDLYTDFTAESFGWHGVIADREGMGICEVKKTT